MGVSGQACVSPVRRGAKKERLRLQINPEFATDGISLCRVPFNFSSFLYPRSALSLHAHATKMSRHRKNSPHRFEANLPHSPRQILLRWSLLYSLLSLSGEGPRITSVLICQRRFPFQRRVFPFFHVLLYLSPSMSCRCYGGMRESHRGFVQLLEFQESCLRPFQSQREGGLPSDFSVLPSVPFRFWRSWTLLSLLIFHPLGNFFFLSAAYLFCLSFRESLLAVAPSFLCCVFVPGIF